MSILYKQLLIHLLLLLWLVSLLPWNYSHSYTNLALDVEIWTHNEKLYIDKLDFACAMLFIFIFIQSLSDILCLYKNFHVTRHFSIYLNVYRMYIISGIMNSMYCVFVKPIPFFFFFILSSHQQRKINKLSSDVRKKKQQHNPLKCSHSSSCWLWIYLHLNCAKVANEKRWRRRAKTPVIV